MALTLEEAVARLGDKTSAKRRSAAKRLGALADEAAGPALLDALRREADVRRSWETRYELAVALGACGHRPAVGLLTELALRPTEDDAVHTALGEAIVRLRSLDEGLTAPLEWCLDQADPSLTDGALRAAATLGGAPAPTTVGRILDLLDPLDPYDGLRHWAAVAAANWPGERVDVFLESCAAGPRADVAEAARTSLEARHAATRHAAT
ncbi:HEAT repeat domain-containing protein [Streptomyces sp. NPDC001930]|uniref:HEAT repeat domain-containing protein n=1 Tax=Streptomyces sp. NPDC001930 TaxID=3364625 RepID=UPI0036955448